MPTAKKTLAIISQVTPPATLASNATTLANVSALAALNPKDLLALQVFLRTIELANDSSSPVTTYNLGSGSNAAIVTAAQKLIQDAKTYMGQIPVGDLRRVSAAIDWNNAKAVSAGISTDVDTLRNMYGMSQIVDLSEDEMVRILLYLRLEIGE